MKKLEYKCYTFNNKGGTIDIIEDNWYSDNIAPRVAQVYASEEIPFKEEMPDELIKKAKVFAAAPNLLEALQNLLHLHDCEMEGLAFPSKEQWLEAVKKGEAAIQKAIG